MESQKTQNDLSFITTSQCSSEFDSMGLLHWPHSNRHPDNISVKVTSKVYCFKPCKLSEF